MSIKATLYHRSIFFLFDIGSVRIRPLLIRRFGRNESTIILTEARQELDRLIPQLPDIGGWSNPHTQFIVAAALFLTLYRVLKSRNQSAEEIGSLIFEAVSKIYSSYLLRPISILNPIQRRLFGNHAARQLSCISQQRRYADDFVCAFIEGDGVNFDYGFDYFECGICKFYHHQNADEFTKYMCRLDYPYAGLIGTKLKRTTTLAEGSGKCDFRFSEQNERR